MRALVVNGSQADPRLSVKDLPTPTAAIGEVLIRVSAAGVIPTELGWPSTWTQKSGRARIDTVPSHEFSGTVASVGPGVQAIRVGDEVFGMSDWFLDGGQAEYCTAAVEHIAPKPPALSHTESASVPISALTAWQALFEHAGLNANERVLIHGGAGSVGAFAVQLARDRNAFVIATASANDQDFVMHLGAAEVVDYHAQAFETAGLVDVVIDTVGGEALRRSWSVLKPGGRLATIASSSEGQTDERSRKAFFIVKPDSSQLAHIASLLDRGNLKTFVKHVVPLSNAANEYVEPAKGTEHGKTIVRVSQP